LRRYILQPLSFLAPMLLGISLGLDDPLPTQYLRYLENLLRGDLGRSLTTRSPVSHLCELRLSGENWTSPPGLVNKTVVQCK